MNISPATLFSVLSHDTRLRCVVLLLDAPELCVCELTAAIGAAQPHMSRHLAQLRAAGMVLDRREGQWIHYRVNPALPAWVRAVLTDTVRGVSDMEPFVSDRRAVAGDAGRTQPWRCA